MLFSLTVCVPAFTLVGRVCSLWHDWVLRVGHTPQHLLQQAHRHSRMAGGGSHDEKGERLLATPAHSNICKNRHLVRNEYFFHGNDAGEIIYSGILIIGIYDWHTLLTIICDQSVPCLYELNKKNTFSVLQNDLEEIERNRTPKRQSHCVITSMMVWAANFPC